MKSNKTGHLHLDWDNIETVMLDMDGTLLDLHFDNYFWLHYVPQCYARQNKLADEQAKQALLQRYAEVRGSLDWYCVDFWTDELDMDIARLKHELAEKIVIRPEVDDFLQWLNQHHKQVWLVTNAHPASLDLKMEKTGLHGHFDRLIHSHALGLAKEHTGFWEKLQDTASYRPQNTLLIDDNFEVLASARAYGIAHCLGIHLPDSQSEPVAHNDYYTIRNFSDIIN